TDILIRLRCLETARPFEFPKERAGERSVRVRQRDHHKTLAWPDMERLLFHLPRTIRPGRNGELFVTVGEITFVILEIREFLVHRLTHGRERAIHANDGIGADLDYLTNRICRRHACLYRRVDELSRSRVEIDIGATMTEMDSHVRITLRCFDHRRVERRPADW